MIHQVQLKIGEENLILESGKMAKQANGAVFGQYAGSAVIATACCSTQDTGHCQQDYAPYLRYTEDRSCNSQDKYVCDKQGNFSIDPDKHPPQNRKCRYTTANNPGNYTQPG